MIPRLSTRAFKYLRKISLKSGLEYADQEIHDIGTRLLGLSVIAAGAKEKDAKRPQALLTESEIKGVEVLREQFAAAGRMASARELSHALGYQSSRSGHVLLHRLLAKGVLVKRSGQLTFAE